MFSIETFRKESIQVPVYLYVFMFVVYKISEYFGFIQTHMLVEKFTFWNLIAVVVFFLLYRRNKISYKVFMYFFTLSIFIVLNLIVVFNVHVIYRIIWIIALIPFVFLYAGRKIGSFFSVYFLILIIYCYYNGLFIKISLQDLYVYVFSNILVASISYFFVLSLEKFTFSVEETHKFLEDQANRDELTDIYNRRGFFKFVENKKGVLGIFDLDDFKAVNDKYGHEFGDLYLKKFVEILKKHCRKSDLVARIGGDEFVVCFVDSDIKDMKKRIEKFYSDLRKNKIKGINISVSSGFFECKESLKDTLIKADELLYESKKKKNTFTFPFS